MNGRDYLSPEQEDRLAERSKQIEQEFRNKAPERARVAEETKRTMEAREAAERPLVLERHRQMQQKKDLEKENIIRDWLEMNPTFIKNDKTTIPAGKKIAVFVSNNVSTLTTNQVLYFPNFYLGNEIVAVERSGGRKTKRRRSRKSKKSKQN